jgi:hypothetical protein
MTTRRFALLFLAAQSGTSMRALIIRALEDTCSKKRKGKYVTGPMIKGKPGAKLGPLFPKDENPHDLVFPDVNVWIALSDAGNSHAPDAWRWLNELPADGTSMIAGLLTLGSNSILSRATSTPYFAKLRGPLRHSAPQNWLATAICSPSPRKVAQRS